jgi:tRNA(fMet)-specific endonuclease VapC
LDLFFNGLSQVYKIDNDIAYLFGDVKSKLRKKGAIIDDIDILISATCLINDLPIITYNKKHFDRIDGLVVKTPDDFLK